MTARDLMEFCLTALQRHRLRTVLSLLGVAVGVAAVVALTALGEGARRYVVEQFSAIGSNLLLVLPGKTETTGFYPGFSGVPNDLTLDDLAALRQQLRGAERVVPLVVGSGTVAFGDRRRDVAVTGTTREMMTVRKMQMASGDFLPAGEDTRGAPIVVLGHKVAAELFPGLNPVGQVLRVGDWRMRVIGVLAPQGVNLGLNMDEVAIVPVETGMRMFNRTSLFRIFVQLHAAADMNAVRTQAVSLLTARHGEEDFTVITQDAVLSAFTAIFGVLTLALTGIAAISLTVAGLGIMNVMLVSVSERTGEVGLLKAVGVHRGQILRVFLVEAALLGSAGGLLGLLIGWIAVRILVGFVPQLPASPPAWAVAAALGVSVVVGTIFGVLPARRAAALDPVAALSRR